MTRLKCDPTHLLIVLNGSTRLWPITLYGSPKPVYFRVGSCQVAVSGQKLPPLTAGVPRWGILPIQMPSKILIKTYQTCTKNRETLFLFGFYYFNQRLKAFKRLYKLIVTKAESNFTLSEKEYKSFISKKKRKLQHTL